MKEIEILVNFDNTKEEILEKFEKYQFIKKTKLIDTYYLDKLRKNLKPMADLRLNEVFRIRETDQETEMTYKINHFKDDNGNTLMNMKQK